MNQLRSDPKCPQKHAVRLLIQSPLSFSASKLQHAHDPPFFFPLPLNLPFVNVQDTPVAHEGSLLGSSNDLTEWGDTILSPHNRCSRNGLGSDGHFTILATRS